jgi:hypothetical protein
MTKKRKLSTTLIMISLTFICIFSSCESDPTEEELKTVLCKPEDAKNYNSNIEKYVGKTLEEINTEQHLKHHRLRKTERQMKRECRKGFQ